MNTEKAIRFFGGLSREERTLFLARLTLEVTIVARSTYSDDGESADGKQLREYNEILHRVAGFETGMLDGSPTYPDDVFVKIVLGSNDPQASRYMEIAFEAAAHGTRPEFDEETVQQDKNGQVFSTSATEHLLGA